MDKCNCEFYWKEVSKFSSICSKHNSIFDIGSKCPFYDISKKEVLKDFTSNSQAITSNSQRVHILKRKYDRKVTDSIYERFHNYGVKFIAEVQWEHLFKYEEVKLNNNVSYKRIDLDNCLIKVFKKSILVTLRSSKDIIGLDVESAEFKAKSIINDVLDKLPKSIIVSNRDIVNTHNAFINDPLAKVLPDNSKIYINDELRYINDKSHDNIEGEFVSKKWAIPDSKMYQEDLKSLIDKGLTREVLANNINILIKDRMFWAEHQKSHVASIDKLGVNTDLNTNSINELKNVIIELKEQFLSSTNTSQKEECYRQSISIPPSFNLPSTISKYDLERKEKIKQFINEYR